MKGVVEELSLWVFMGQISVEPRNGYGFNLSHIIYAGLSVLDHTASVIASLSNQLKRMITENRRS